MNNEQENIPTSDEESELMAETIKRSSVTHQPDEHFVRQLQTKIINEFHQTKPLNEKKSMRHFNWKVFTSYAAGLAVMVVAIYLGIQNTSLPPSGHRASTPFFTVSNEALPKFASCQALTETIKDNANQSSGRNGILDMFSIGKTTVSQSAGSTPTTAPATEEADDLNYSQTNIQVAGVDEADTVKTDGQYIYTISGNTVYIAKAIPPADATLTAKITINGTPGELFINGKNLLVFGTRNNYVNPSGAEDLKIRSESSSAGTTVTTPSIAPDIAYPSYQSLTFVEIYNLTDPAKPELKRKLDFDGTYISSRMIGDYVYFVMNNYPDYRLLQTNTNTTVPPTEIVPMYRDTSGATLDTPTTTLQPMVGCTDVAYVDPIVSNQYLSVIGLPINDYTKEVTKEVILGGAGNVYASQDNLYIANTSWQAYSNGLLDTIRGSYPDEKTILYKFALNKDSVKYQGTTDIPGTILNQYSMDEYNDYFRIATTTGQVWDTNNKSTNNVYILDKSLKLSGSLTNIAPGEKYYSTRFIGDRAYLVTFKKTDPFFTVDLSDPQNPKILGQLKIPGYSDYLHPYDANHVIGIGKEATDSETGDFAWYQGMKLAIFDVTDVAHPTEMWKTTIGDRGTDSPVLQNPKAFLFSKEKNLLVIPVTLAELTDAQKAAELPVGTDVKSAYGQFTYQGSYVYDISLDKGFVLKGRITQYANSDVFLKSGYYMNGEFDITRNLYIDNSLYSLSSKQIMINSLIDLAEQGKVDLE